ALVMVGAFAIFATLPFLDFKEMGIGLAAAVLIDATIVRGVLLPATMKLLGDKNWYLPQWLQWLPRIDHGSTPLPQPAAARPHPTAGAAARGPGLYLWRPSDMDTAVTTPTRREPSSGRLVAASLVGILALLLLAVGGAGLWSRASSDGGYISTGSHPY